MSAVRVVRIDQGHVRNAINGATAERLHDEFLAFEADDDAKVAVLYGDERAFCAGANLTDLPALRPSGPLGPTRLQLSKPVIAAIEGWCVAGGFELAAWCDLRVCGEGARFGCLERRWGVPLVDGGTVRLPRIVGLGGPSTSSSPAGRSTPPRPTTSASPTASCPTATPWRPRWRWLIRSPSSPGRAWCTTGCRPTRRWAWASTTRSTNEDRHGREVIFAPGFAEGVERFTKRRR